MIHSTQTDDGIIIVRPGVQRLTAVNSKAFKDEIVALIDAGNSEFVIDFTSTTFLDSSGLGALAGVLKKIGHRGDLAVCGLGPDVMQMFTICRMDRVFSIYPDEAAALRALSEKS
ncbi:anti-sigma factor antagonist [Loktanella sp. D2R18]|uniref:STAS domain-containing protein n=1 Tax=Rhodobacterales TaxID=204455 RepID=UPI000DEACBFD|nr:MULTISPECIES: STAS domain-containing protein [Rhodobacterales]MDO6591884.1 STAS domain-containing protein [Yoonia sp. 1_MG-2023]RBW42685.1 anti-sigma factor antagonist [Loktanella sp. D2R18]